MCGRYWLLLSAAWGWAALASQPPPQTTGSQPPVSPSQKTTQPAADAPSGADEDLIEFLGSDDADAASWAFLKKAQQRKDQPPAPPPQDAKQ